MDPTMPPWLQALLQQTYPGKQDMTPSQVQGAVNEPGPWNGAGVPYGPPTRPGYQHPNVFPQVNQPSSIGALAATHAGMPPGPNSVFPQVNMPPAVEQMQRYLNLDPRNSGGASSQSAVQPIPSPQRANRTANNPPFDTFQYNVPGTPGVLAGGQAGGQNRSPIYTALDMSKLFGGGPIAPPAPSRVPISPPNSPAKTSSTPSTYSRVDPMMGPLQRGSVWPNRMGPYMNPDTAGYGP